MRRYLLDYLLGGASIGLIALAIQLLTDGASRTYQLLAVGLAGLALFGIQLLLARRVRRVSQHQIDEIDAGEDPQRLRRYRRDPFSRELTHNWTGLDAYQPPPPPPDDTPDPAAPKPSDEPPTVER